MPSPPTGCVAQPTGLANWYRAEGDFIDTRGAVNATPQNGTTFTSGKVGQAFNFNGVEPGGNQVLTPTINLGSQFSVELWVRPTSSTQRFQHLVSNGYTSTNFGALYFDGGSSTGTFTYWHGGSQKVISPVSIQLNTWYHVAVTYDGSLTRLYVNGVLVDTSTAHTETFDNPVMFGYAAVGSDHYFTGQLDEVSLYNGALTAAQIQSIVDADSAGKCLDGTPPPGGPPGLTADYQFQNTRNSSGGGPPLTDLINLGNGANTFTTEAIDGCAPRSVLSFPKGNGLTLSPITGLTTDNKTYTIVMLFKFLEQNTNRAIIDFRNFPTDDRGIYAAPDNNLNFYNTQNNGPGISSGIGSPLTANKWVQVVFTRQESDLDGKDADVGYVDGVHQYKLESNGEDGIVDPQSNTLRFFLNPVQPENTAYSAGSVARIRIFNRVLTPGEVAALDRLPSDACSTPTPTPTGSPSPSPTPGVTPTPTPTPGVTPTPTPDSTPTPNPSPTGTPPTGTVTFPGTNLGDIPDGNCAGPGLQIQFAVSGVTGPISDIRVSLTGTHTYVGDLDALLIDPGNTASEFLFTFTGNDLTPQFGDSSDLNGTYSFFDSASNNWWTAAAAVDGVTAIAPGDYKASNALGQTVLFDPVFANIANPNGTWILKVNDCWPGDTGTITAASLAMTGAATISGRVLTPSGLGLRSANVSLIDAQGVKRTVPTSNLGFYLFENVRIGEQYTLTVASRRYRFASRIETFAGARSDVDFVGIE